MASLLVGGRIILGVVLVVIGIVGLVLPGIQGIAGIVIGAFLLGMRRAAGDRLARASRAPRTLVEVHHVAHTQHARCVWRAACEGRSS